MMDSMTEVVSSPGYGDCSVRELQQLQQREDGTALWTGGDLISG